MEAPLAVAVEVRALDTPGERVWRVSIAIGEDGLRLRRDLPFEAGRPVRVELTLPDEETPVAAKGTIVGVAPDDPALEGESARPRAVRFRGLDEDARLRISRYVVERNLLP